MTRDDVSTRSTRGYQSACALACALAIAAQAVLMQLPRATALLPADTSTGAVHLLLELFAFVIAVLVVTISWHTFRLRNAPPPSLLIAGFTIVAACDLLHALSYRDMPAFLGPSGEERSIFFWLMGRSFELATLLTVAFDWTPRIPRTWALGLGLAVSCAVLWLGLSDLQVFPATFVPGSGVTAFKARYEVALCALDLVATALLWRRGLRTGRRPLFLLATSAFLMGIGELSFTAWVQLADFQNVFGHLFKIASYALIYRAAFLTSLRAPFDAVHESEARFDAIIRLASDAVISTDAQGRILLFNPAAETIFGHRAADLLGRPIDGLLPESARRAHGCRLEAFAETGKSNRAVNAGRVLGLRSDGATLQLDASISKVTVNGRLVLTAILRDVTDRVRAERSLVQHQIELTELAHRLMDQERATTSRLAQILHDRLGQTLTAMRIDFVSEARLADPAEAARHQRVDRLLDQAIGEVRHVLTELRPTILDERGLVEALRNELALHGLAANGAPVHLQATASAEEQRWDPAVEYAAFMVAREAIGNAQRHAKASAVKVDIQGDSCRLSLQIVDDGIGLEAGALAPRPGHLGLVGMRERAIAIGARFEVRAAPGRGTCVSLDWETLPA